MSLQVESNQFVTTTVNGTFSNIDNTTKTPTVLAGAYFQRGLISDGVIQCNNIVKTTYLNNQNIKFGCCIVFDGLTAQSSSW